MIVLADGMQPALGRLCCAAHRETVEKRTDCTAPYTNPRIVTSAALGTTLSSANFPTVDQRRKSSSLCILADHVPYQEPTMTGSLPDASFRGPTQNDAASRQPPVVRTMDLARPTFLQATKPRFPREPPLGLGCLRSWFLGAWGWDGPAAASACAPSHCGRRALLGHHVQRDVKLPCSLAALGARFVGPCSLGQRIHPVRVVRDRPPWPHEAIPF